jgi:site-specific DNA-methyltransferase (adenine-specific)
MKPYYSDELVTLYLGDMRQVLPALAVQADAVVTDPPYEETSLGWDRWPVGWPALVANHTRSMWCFGSMRMFLDRRDEFAGWRMSQDVVWEKNNGSGFASGDRFVRVHELALHFYRGEWGSVHHVAPRRPHYGPNRSWVSTGADQAPNSPHRRSIGARQSYEDDGTRVQRSVIYARSCKGRAIHPTEKPEQIIAPLIEYAVPPGGLVLDVFAGSCAVGLTARQLGRRAVCIEADEEHCEKAAERLSVPDLFGGVVA